MMAKKKIYSKRSKTVKGEYDVFRNKTKIGEIFKSPNDQGKWAGALTNEGEKLLNRTEYSEYAGTSVGGPTKWRILDWFKEWFSY